MRDPTRGYSKRKGERLREALSVPANSQHLTLQVKETDLWPQNDVIK